MKTGVFFRPIFEVYTPNVTFLQKYIERGDINIDPYDMWDGTFPVDPSIVDWLEENYPQIIQSWMEREGVDDPNDLDPDYYWELPEKIRDQYTERIREDYIEWMLKHASADAPTNAFYSSPQLLKRTTWLVHFSDESWNIASEGFKYGMDDMDRLGLTTWFKNEAKNMVVTILHSKQIVSMQSGLPKKENMERKPLCLQMLV